MQKFLQVQHSLGLRKQFFDAKFVYSQQQISNPDAFLISMSKQLPGQINGFTQNDIQIIHAFACQILYQATKALNVPISTSIVAQQLFHFFYARKSYLEYDVRDILMGCMYLACKSQQTLKKSYEIALVFDYIFKVSEGDKKINALQLKSSQYEHIKNRTIMKAQLDILFQLGFQVYRLYDIPHRYIGSFLTLFQRHPKFNAICQETWKKLNDCYCTTACLYFPHNIIAAAAVYMGMRQCQASFPQVPWWTLLEANEQKILIIQGMVINLLANKKNISLSFVSSKISEIGEKAGLLNSFPIPYYRKIMLEKRGKFRVTKQILQKSENKPNYVPSNVEIVEVTKFNLNERKIVKVKQFDQDLQQKKPIDKNTNNDTQQKQKQKQLEIKKIVIDKKNLFASINQKLQKHEASLNKKIVQPSDALSQQEDAQLMAELRKKIQKKKQAQINDKNK